MAMSGISHKSDLELQPSGRTIEKQSPNADGGFQKKVSFSKTRRVRASTSVRLRLAQGLRSWASYKGGRIRLPIWISGCRS